MKIAGPIKQRPSAVNPEATVIGIPIEHAGAKQTILVFAFPRPELPWLAVSAEVTRVPPTGKTVTSTKPKESGTKLATGAALKEAERGAVEETVARLRKVVTIEMKAGQKRGKLNGAHPAADLAQVVRAELSAILKETKS